MKSIETIIDRQVRKWELQKLRAQRESSEQVPFNPVITVARMVGADGEKVAESLARRTGFHLVDNEILESIASDFGVQSRIIELLDENSRSELESWFRGMITGRIIDSSDYVHSLTRTLGAIARHGRAIIIGRGSNIVLGMRHGFHLRIVGSRETRIKRIMLQKSLSRAESERLLIDSDTRRTEFVRKSFGADANDPSLYDMTLNTDVFEVSGAVDLALAGYQKKRNHLT